MMTQPSRVSASMRLAGSEAGKRCIADGAVAEGIVENDISALILVGRKVVTYPLVLGPELISYLPHFLHRYKQIGKGFQLY